MTIRTFTLVAALIVAGLQATIAQQGPAQADKLLAAAQHKAIVDGDLKAAIEQYKSLAAGGDRSVAAQALLQLADCYQKLGAAEARSVYERLLRDFSDFAGPASEARTRLAALQPAPAAATKQVARQISTDTWVDQGPSADGRYFSFQMGSTGDLGLRDVQTGTTRNLTDTGGWLVSGDYVSDSLVSPDGREVAYAWFVEKEHKNELRLISTAVGARPRMIVRTERNDYFRPSGWSTDGRQLFVIRALPDTTWQIGTVAVQDGSYRSLKSLAWRDPNRVTVSPDGRYLAYAIPSGERGSPHDIYLLAADASGEGAVVQSSANDTAPLWSADGSSLVFMSDRTGNNSIWQVPIRDGKPAGSPRLVKADVGQIVPLGMTREGALYYLLSGSPRRNIYVAELDAVGRAAQPTLLTERFLNTNTGPSWSRDGQYVAYFSMRNPMVLVIRSVQSGEERTLPLPSTVVSQFQGGPKWFPDGRSVLVLSRENAGTAFHRIKLDTGQVELMWRINQGGPSSYDVSPDGRSIFYVQQNTGNRPLSGRLVRVDLEQRQEVELKKDEWFITLAVSPDGSQVAVLKSLDRRANADSPSAIDVVPTAGGPSREVFRAAVWLDGSRYNALAWTADQRFVMFARGCAADCPNVMWRVPVAGGAAEEIGLVMRGIKSPAVHPDGRRIVFGANDGGSPEIWALENFLK